MKTTEVASAEQKLNVEQMNEIIGLFKQVNENIRLVESNLTEITNRIEKANTRALGIFRTVENKMNVT